MNDAKIAVLLITHNDVNEIDKTIASVRMQDFPKENVWLYIVDFESTDGTYKKALTYERHHTAVFQVPDTYNERARISRAVELMNANRTPSTFEHIVSLRPGDTLYEQCFSICAKTLRKYREQGANLLVCESDIVDLDGTMHCQRPIAEKELLITLQDIHEIGLEHFFNHYLGYFGGELKAQFQRHYCLGNERYCWNKIFYSIGGMNPFVYLPQTLFCLKERICQDEVEEVLLQWEGITSFKRRVQGWFDPNRLDLGHAQQGLARYCLWRLCKRFSELSRKEREDLLYLAEIIDPEISKTGIYSECQKRVQIGLNVDFGDYITYFEECDHEATKKMSSLWK